MRRRTGAPCPLSAFESLCELLVWDGRRRLVRHQLVRHHAECRCVDSDEAVLAHFVSTAATGAREDAMMIATLLVRADLICIAVSLAQAVELAAARMSVGADPARTAPPGAAWH